MSNLNHLSMTTTRRFFGWCSACQAVHPCVLARSTTDWQATSVGVCSVCGGVIHEPVLRLSSVHREHSGGVAEATSATITRVYLDDLAIPAD